MATLAQFFNQFSGAKAIADAAAFPAAEERSAAYKLRAVPNEDVYFYIKRIDNSRVVSKPTPGLGAGTGPCSAGRDSRPHASLLSCCRVRGA